MQNFSSLAIEESLGITTPLVNGRIMQEITRNWSHCVRQSGITAIPEPFAMMSALPV